MILLATGRQQEKDSQTARDHGKITVCVCRKIQRGYYGRRIPTGLAELHERTERQHRRVEETGIQAGQRVFPQTGRRLT